MLKHVTYRSTSSLGRASSDLTCRGQLSPDTMSLKGEPSPMPDLPVKSATLSRTPDKIRYQSPDRISMMCPDTISLKDDGYERSPDSISLHSTLSFTSLAAGRLSSRCSSISSLSDKETTPVKVYLRSLRPDFEYKTVPLTSATTCRELIAMLLAKFRIKHRDPNLFFITMEVIVRGPGSAPVKRILVLEDNARPAELQQCRPRGEARFSIGVRKGGLLRIHDSILMPGSQYKSLLVSFRTTSEELIKLLLNCYGNKESPKHYAVHIVCKTPYNDRQLRPDEHPLHVQSEWSAKEKQIFSFVLRRNIAYALSLKQRMSWRHSLDLSSTDTESEHDIEDHNTTSSTLFSASSVSSAISLSSNASSRSSSSGVSSASSSISSPTHSPIKPRSLSNNDKLSSTTEKNIINSNMNILNMTASLPPRSVPRTLFSMIGSSTRTTEDLATLIINEDDTPSSESESASNSRPICTKPCCFRTASAMTQSTPTKTLPILDLPSSPTSIPIKSLLETPKFTPNFISNRSLPATTMSSTSQSVPSTPESKLTSTISRPFITRSVSTIESTPISTTLPRNSLSKSTSTLATTPSIQRTSSSSSSKINSASSSTTPCSELMLASDLDSTPRRPSMTRSTITLTLVKQAAPKSAPTTPMKSSESAIQSPESTTSTLTPQSTISPSRCLTNSSCCSHYENCFYI